MRRYVTATRAASRHAAVSPGVLCAALTALRPCPTFARPRAHRLLQAVVRQVYRFVQPKDRAQTYLYDAF